METARAFTVWITGLPKSGKSSVADALTRMLRARGLEAEIIDSGKLRGTPLGASLGFSREDRDVNVRRHGLAARMLTAHGVIAIVAAVSPYRDTREAVRRELGSFVEVYAATSKGACIDRDNAGIWRRALAGEIQDFTGVDAPYEPPESPDVRFDLSNDSIEAAAHRIADALEARGLVPTGDRPADGHKRLAERLRMLGYES